MAYRPGANKETVKEALTEQGLTIPRAGNLDLLDASITTVTGKIGGKEVEASVLAADNTSGLSVSLDTEHRTQIEVNYNLGGAGSMLIECSNNGTTWDTIESHTFASASSGWIGLNNARKHIRVSSTTPAIDISFKIISAR